jgi:hypothetical protein
MESHEKNIASSERHTPAAEPSHFLSEEDSIVHDSEDGCRHEEGSMLPHTIHADITSNRKFLGRQTRISLFLILIILILKILPSPLIVTTV